MTQPPFQMDPSARFDDEVARIARENDADVVFQLVEREDLSVCDFHDPEVPTTRSERYTFTITHPDGTVTDRVVCKDHGIWLHAQQPERELPEGSNDLAAKLKPQLPELKVEGGKRVREPIDRGPGGGPGGRSMAPDRPPHVGPPPQKIERTYPPPSGPDGGRLVVGSVGGFRRACIPPIDAQAGLDRLPIEWIFEPVGVVHLASEVVRIVVVRNGGHSVVQHLCRLRPPPRIGEIATTLGSNFRPRGNNCSQWAASCRVRPITAVSQPKELVDYPCEVGRGVEHRIIARPGRSPWPSLIDLGLPLL